MLEHAHVPFIALQAPQPKPARFVWPPASAGSVWPARTAPALSPTQRALARVRSFLHPTLLALERDWLGVVDGSWARRAAEANFLPDAAGDYCPSCGSSWDLQLGQGLCKACDTHPVPWQRCIRLAKYEGPLRDAILECKHASGRALGEQLGKELGRALAAHLERAQIDPARVVLVPIPMSLPRWLLRGRDHTLALARGMRSQTGLPIVRLLRREHRPQQTGTTLDVRKVNVRKSMHVRTGRLAELEAVCPAPRLLVLVDDVLTSGATMREAVRALEAAGMAFSDEPGAETSAQGQVWTVVAGVTSKPSQRDAPEGGAAPTAGRR